MDDRNLQNNPDFDRTEGLQPDEQPVAPDLPSRDPDAAGADPNEGALPADAPIPNLPESALPQDPEPAVEVPAEAMPGTDANGDPIEQPQDDGSPESNLQTEQPDQPVPPAPEQ